MPNSQSEFRIALRVFGDDNNTIVNDERVKHMMIFPRHQVPQTRKISEPRALWMAVNIREIALLPGDQLVIRDKYNLSTIIITRENQTVASKAWTQRLLWNHPFLTLGNSVTIEYWPSITTLILPINRKQLDNAIAVIDSYTYVYRITDNMTNDVRVDKESVVGVVNEMKPAICYKTKQPLMYQHARAVARLLIRREDEDPPKEQLVNHDNETNTWNFCTGWLIGRGNHMMTNYHCFYTYLGSQNRRGAVTFPSIQQDLAGADAHNVDASINFMAESSCRNESSRNRKRQHRSVANPSGLIETSNVTVLAADEQLDYCLIRLNTDNGEDLARKYGYLTLRGPPIDGETIYIPQHPHGAVKMIASTKNGEPAIIRVLSLTSSSSGSVDVVNTAVYDNVSVWYNADTAPGSSGSPVLSQHDHSVIALHHAGTSQTLPITRSAEDPLAFNLGIRIDAIINNMLQRDVLPPCAISRLCSNVSSDDCCNRQW